MDYNREKKRLTVSSGASPLSRREVRIGAGGALDNFLGCERAFFRGGGSSLYSPWSMHWSKPMSWVVLFTLWPEMGAIRSLSPASPSSSRSFLFSSMSRCRLSSYSLEQQNESCLGWIKVCNRQDTNLTSDTLPKVMVIDDGCETRDAACLQFPATW